MARIAGIELNDNWRVVFALTRIKGIGWSLAKEITSTLKIDEVTRVGKLTAEELSGLTKELEKYSTEGDLIRDTRGNIQRLKTVGTYRGIRHQRGLPARGQRTKTNARTKRGSRKTVGAFKKEQLTKMQQQQKKEETK